MMPIAYMGVLHGLVLLPEYCEEPLEVMCGKGKLLLPLPIELPGVGVVEFDVEESGISTSSGGETEKSRVMRMVRRRTSFCEVSAVDGEGSGGMFEAVYDVANLLLRLGDLPRELNPS